jgi:hypothetical protein
VESARAEGGAREQLERRWAALAVSGRGETEQSRAEGLEVDKGTDS